MPDHTEDSREYSLPDGTRRRVKRLRYLGEVWVPESALDSLLSDEPGNEDADTTEDDHAEE